MVKALPGGAWPTMVTFFKEDGSLDFNANAAFTKHLIKRGATGLFAVCQSSEMTHLTLAEKADLAKCVVDAAEGAVPVIASGHTSDDVNAQIEELGLVSETGVDAVVLVTNRLAKREEDKTTLLGSIDRIAAALPGVDFGMYECPAPFLRLLSLEELSIIAKDGKVGFFKDVSCNASIQQERARAVAGTNMGLYNANAETLFNSFPYGYKGYNGIMGNYHIDIYRWFSDNYLSQPELAKKVQTFFNTSGKVHKGAYPLAAKYHFILEGGPGVVMGRTQQPDKLTDDIKEAIKQLIIDENSMRKELGIL